MQPADVKLSVTVGSVVNPCGQLDFVVEVKGDGDGWVRIRAHDPSDARNPGVLLFLNLDAYNGLRRVIQKTDETIKDLQGKANLKRLAAPSW